MQLTAVRDQMIDKLAELLSGKTSGGIRQKLGEESMTKGSKFSRKNIEANLFPTKNIFRDESNYNVPEEVNLISTRTVSYVPIYS